MASDAANGPGPSGWTIEQAARLSPETIVMMLDDLSAALETAERIETALRNLVGYVSGLDLVSDGSHRYAIEVLMDVDRRRYAHSKGADDV